MRDWLARTIEAKRWYPEWTAILYSQCNNVNCAIVTFHERPANGVISSASRALQTSCNRTTFTKVKSSGTWDKCIGRRRRRSSTGLTCRLLPFSFLLRARGFTRVLLRSHRIRFRAISLRASPKPQLALHLPDSTMHHLSHGQILVFNHGCSPQSRLFCLQLPFACPTCNEPIETPERLQNGGLLKTLPSPLKCASSSSCALAIRPSMGHFLT